MRDVDVVICGAGVGGLTLAALLARRGWSVLLVEKQRRYRTEHKGELIQPRSLEILDQAGLLEPVLGAGARTVSALACRTAAGGGLVSLDYGLLAGRFRYGMVQSYRDMLVTLAAQLGPGVTVWRGARAERLLRDRGGRVCGVAVSGDHGPARILARLTVAGDGHGSRLRQDAGIQVTPHRYGHQLAGFEFPETVPLGSEMNAYLTARGLRALFGLPGGQARLYVQIPAGSLRGVGRAGLPGWAELVLRATPALQPVAGPLLRSLGTVQVKAAWRFLAPDWVRPGFALIGDAAHCVHPMVGQGMNAAIADAWELTGALAAHRPLTACRVDAALRRYQEVRQPQMGYVARLSHNMACLLTSTSWVGRAFRPGLLRRNQDNDRLRFRLTRNMAGLAAEPLTLTDWVSASGLLSGVLGRPVTDLTEEPLARRIA